MATSDDQAQTEKGNSGTMLLPSSGAFLPSGGIGKNLGDKGGEALAQEIAQAGTEVREFASRAIAAAVEKAPEFKRAAQEAGEKVGEMAGKAFKDGAASTHHAKEAFADPTKRKAFRKPLAIMFAVALIAIAGGLGFVKHQANTAAKDQIDGFLIRNNLRDTVSYEAISGSPFGSATMSGVRVKISPSTAITVGTLDISDIEMKGGMLLGMSLAAAETEVPLLAIAKQNPHDKVTLDFVGMGYTTIRGDITATARYDDQKGIMSFETAGSLNDGDSWKLNIDLGGISPIAFTSLAEIQRSAAHEDSLETLKKAAMGFFQALTQVTLAQASFTIDNSGSFKRAKEVPDTDMPLEDGDTARVAAFKADLADLVKAGVSPSEAQAMREHIDNWLRKGGTLKLETNIAQPVPLFKRGAFFTPAFNSPAEFLVVTKSKIST
jgi:hypothetical protein